MEFWCLILDILAHIKMHSGTSNKNANVKYVLVEHTILEGYGKYPKHCQAHRGVHHMSFIIHVITEWHFLSAKSCCLAIIHFLLKYQSGTFFTLLKSFSFASSSSSPFPFPSSILSCFAYLSLWTKKRVTPDALLPLKDTEQWHQLRTLCEAIHFLKWPLQNVCAPLSSDICEI